MATSEAQTRATQMDDSTPADLMAANPAAATTKPPAMTTGRPTLSDSAAAVGAATPTAREGSRLHSAAESGL